MNILLFYFNHIYVELEVNIKTCRRLTNEINSLNLAEICIHLWREGLPNFYHLIDPTFTNCYSPVVRVLYCKSQGPCFNSRVWIGIVC